MKLAIIGDTRHYVDEKGRLCALTPVVTQLDLWAELFDEVIICAPLLSGFPPPIYTPYRSRNISIEPLKEGGGNTLKAKLDLIPKAFHWVPRIWKVIRQVDALHFRCPCNIAFFGILAAFVSNRHRYAMYAGDWSGYKGEALSNRVQRWLLSRPSFGGPVTIYSDKVHPSSHLVPFFSPTFTRAEWGAETEFVNAKLAALEQQSTLSTPIRLMTVGHIDKNKNQLAVVQAVHQLRQSGLNVVLDCLGDGEMMAALKQLQDQLQLKPFVHLHGYRPHHSVSNFFRQAHFNILASKTEGYPKVLLEGMIYGAVPIASNFGISNYILGYGERGLTFPYGDVNALADRIKELVADPSRVARMIHAGRQYARTVTLEAFQQRICEILEDHWKVSLHPIHNYFDPQPLDGTLKD